MATLAEIHQVLVEIRDLIHAIHVIHSSTTKKKESKKEKPPYSPLKGGGDFDRFWVAYPKRTINPRRPAQMKFSAAVKAGEDPEVIIAGAQRYAKMMEGKDPQFICMATTWLNQRRWETDGNGAEEFTDIQRYERAREAFRNGKPL